MKESFVFRVWMATDEVWLAGALCVYLILYIHLDMFLPSIFSLSFDCHLLRLCFNNNNNNNK